MFKIEFQHLGGGKVVIKAGQSDVVDTDDAILMATLLALIEAGIASGAISATLSAMDLVCAFSVLFRKLHGEMGQESCANCTGFEACTTMTQLFMMRAIEETEEKFGEFVENVQRSQNDVPDVFRKFFEDKGL